MAPNRMQEALNPFKEVAQDSFLSANDNDNDEYQTDLNPSASADYYAQGSAEAATESALTLDKIKHVSSLLFMRSLFHLFYGRLFSACWGTRLSA